MILVAPRPGCRASPKRSTRAEPAFCFPDGSPRRGCERPRDRQATRAKDSAAT